MRSISRYLGLQPTGSFSWVLVQSWQFASELGEESTNDDAGEIQGFSLQWLRQPS